MSKRRAIRALWLAPALASIGILWAGCSGGEDSLGQGSKLKCLDKDGDGFGYGCIRGSDCDDSDPLVTNSCYACAPNVPGCGCKTEGLRAKCGMEGMGNTCVYGEKVCVGGQWSPCDTTGSEPQLMPQGLGSGTDCTNNPCDPYCQHWPDIPDPTLSNDAGILGTDTGLQLIPHAVIPDATSDGSCASESQKATPIPVDLMLLLDDSGSMDGSSWNSVKTAINNFVFSPQSAGISMGLQFQPLWEQQQVCFLFWCWWDWVEECDVAPYTNPQVGIGALPANGTAIMNAINADSPYGGTPTLPALQGVLQYAKNWALGNTDHKTAVVLATDGEPNICNSSVTAVANAASAGYNGTPSIPTYVIGVGSSLTNLNQIAAAGGTTSAYLVNSGDPAAFQAAMEAIRAKSLSCEFTIPTPSSGELDPATAQVKYTPHGTGTPVYFTKVANAGACGSTNSFYYDNNTSPTKLTLCPTPCNTVKADTTASIDIEFSCKTTCGSESQEATMLDVDMYLMIDRSGSMAGTKWTSMRSALTSFVQSSQSDGLGVGLDYFPLDGSQECTISSYSTPSVAIGHLPANATAIVNSLNATNPSNGTPTWPAEQGAVAYADAWNDAHPGTKTVIVLVTDGEPNDCSSTVTKVANVAAAAYAATPSIPTYVIGVGSNLTNLNQIAAAGGTGSAYLVNGGDATAFLDAMNAIRGQSLTCQFAMPTSGFGTADPDSLKVVYTPNGTGTPQELPKVSSSSACGTGNGWYPDNPSNPTKINLCTTICNTVKADLHAKIDIVFECMKEYNEGWFTRNYDTTQICGPSSAPVYGYWAWNATTPSDSRIDFTVAVADSLTGLYMVPKDGLRFTNPPGPAALAAANQTVGAKAGTPDTQIGSANVDATLLANNRNRQARFIQIQAHLVPSTDKTRTPLLKSWDLQVSCQPFE